MWKIKFAGKTLLTLRQRLEEIKLQQGAQLALGSQGHQSTNIQDHEFRVFSQWGEDGIIQYLIRQIPIAHRTFIEFGVEDFSESNCRFLMMNNNWRGMVIDGSDRNIERIRSEYYFWRHDLATVAAFITRENINGLLSRSGFNHDLGLLSVDIDGNDFHVLQAILDFQPRILVCEYNAVFGAHRKITVPYSADFQRTRRHHSNLYFGASLAALAWIADQRGYDLVGTNSNGVNAFFVRRDLLGLGLKSLTALEAFTPSLTRESRDSAGRLSYLTGDDRLAEIRGLPVLDVVTAKLEPL